MLDRRILDAQPPGQIELLSEAAFRLLQHWFQSRDMLGFAVLSRWASAAVFISGIPNEPQEMNVRPSHGRWGEFSGLVVRGLGFRV